MSPFRFSPRPNQAHEIHWQEWSAAAFDLARLEDKPVLLSISAVWCHWCHVMDEKALSDPDVMGLANGSYVPVRVDSDQRPDVNARYNMGGWPTVALLTPEGDVIAGYTYMDSSRLRTALERGAAAWTRDRQTLLDRSLKARDRLAKQAAAATITEEPDASIVDEVVEAVTAGYDAEHGGFGTQPKFPAVPALDLLLHSYLVTGSGARLEMVQRTLDGMAEGGLYDVEEGGFFRYSTSRDWSAPHYEKMLRDNLDLMDLYARAYLVTGREQYRRVAVGVVDYLLAHLYAKGTGMFFGSQDADEGYYALPVKERRQRGSPGVDGVLYTSLNARAASVFLEGAWVLASSSMREVAVGCLDFLLEQVGHWPLRHSYVPGDAGGIPALLIDYAEVVNALLDAHAETASPGYLEWARHLADEMVRRLSDHEGGGFFDLPEDPEAVGKLRFRDKPLGDNSAAARALVRLHNVTFEGEYREKARGALAALAPVCRRHREAAAEYALALEAFMNPPVEVSVVGAPDRAETRKMLRAAATIPYPHTEVRSIDPEDSDRLAQAGYPAAESPQAYVCLNTVCLAPIEDPEALHGAVRGFLQPQVRDLGSMIRSIGDGG
ncbi:MAG: thioredoxin domain-containing protein [Dehalococcoidia bacterium]|nr:thioredoxin domain-containing protein [Dehalococcoidia bacterium]